MAKYTVICFETVYLCCPVAFSQLLMGTGCFLEHFFVSLQKQVIISIICMLSGKPTLPFPTITQQT